MPRNFKEGDRLMIGGLEYNVIKSEYGCCCADAICPSDSHICNGCEYRSKFGEDVCRVWFKTFAELTAWVKGQKLIEHKKEG